MQIPDMPIITNIPNNEVYHDSIYLSQRITEPLDSKSHKLR